MVKLKIFIVHVILHSVVHVHRTHSRGILVYTCVVELQLIYTKKMVYLVEVDRLGETDVGTVE